MPAKLRTGDRLILNAQEFQGLFDVLKGRGYTVVGPTLRGGDLVYGELGSHSDLPLGWTDEQDGGAYRLKRGEDQYFGYTLGQHSWKNVLHPPYAGLWHARREGDGFQAAPGDYRAAPAAERPPKYALLGVRPCDLHAISMQDRVLAGGEYADPIYEARRREALIVAVNCTRASATCFCASMCTGPAAKSGFDLALTEVRGSGRHYFVAEIGTERGLDVLGGAARKKANENEVGAAESAVARAAARMGRSLDTAGIKELLYRNYEHPRWDEVAERCLTCGNCTMVCPTCFCTDVEDCTDLAGGRAERRRVWHSCFTVDFSYIHGGSVRQSVKSRYRQWMTHKLATWLDQFGTSGCVGCGRCITWCPVGIDITEEARAIRENDGEKGRPAAEKGTEVTR